MSVEYDQAKIAAQEGPRHGIAVAGKKVTVFCACTSDGKRHWMTNMQLNLLLLHGCIRHGAKIRRLNLYQR
jgi:hypothetical protein